MQTKSITATPSQIMVDQLAASGIQHLFYNSGSREALFFDALQSHPDIHGVLGLHEGSVASMAGAYAQASVNPSVMVVHLGAGLAQCLGQFINRHRQLCRPDQPGHQPQLWPNSHRCTADQSDLDRD